MKRIFLLIALFLAHAAFGQQQALDKVTVDLNSSSITAATYPFDAPFYLTGKAPDNCRQINFLYLVKDTLHNIKKWITLPVENPDGKTYFASGQWVPKNGETTSPRYLT